uniref:Uncharacterized protein n=1 Tax=Salmo trutta TaxID=8032 RepID=A0A673XZV0_SALTR
MQLWMNMCISSHRYCNAITVHDFSEKILKQTVHFHVMKLNGFSPLLVGSNPGLVCVYSGFDAAVYLSPGVPSETTQNSLAQRLTKRTKKQVFVSYNLPMTDSNLSLLVENRIKKEMEVHADTFESFAPFILTFYRNNTMERTTLPTCLDCLLLAVLALA